MLAPYALADNKLIQRVYPQPPHVFRTEFMRDRDRIVHSQAFRRMEYKTQVFMNLVGDNFRTRLTHSLEVSQISRTLARTLNLNEDYAETIALGHDMGHPPFGHMGEKVLRKLMRQHGEDGFEHNQQTLRIIEHLEQRYPQHPGLNLTLATRLGLNKHKSIQDELTHPLESSLVNICDEMAYLNHDTDDGLEIGLLTVDQMCEIDLWHEHWQKAKNDFPRGKLSTLSRYTIRNLINFLAENLIENTRNAITESGILSFEDLMKYQAIPTNKPLVKYSADIKASLTRVKKFHFKNLYNHPQVTEQNEISAASMKKVFLYFQENISELPELFQNISSESGPLRATCDFIASMTDRLIFKLAAKI